MKAQLNTVATTLETKLWELRTARLTREALEIEVHPDAVDQVVASTGRDIAVRCMEGNTRQVHEVESALTRLRRGGYGLCESCEEPIAPKRLAAVPWARLCVRCQEQEEAATATEEAILLEAA